MQILFLPRTQAVIADVFIWIALHLIIGYWSTRIPISRFNPDSRLFRTKKWELDGEIYQKLFRIRSWKNFLFSGASFYRDAYEVKHLGNSEIDNLRLWLSESCRSEFCHLLMIPPGFLFYLWNSPDVAHLMVAYAVLNNAVPIIAQRYNRPRVRKLIRTMERRKKNQTAPKSNEASTNTSHKVTEKPERLPLKRQSSPNTEED